MNLKELLSQPAVDTRINSAPEYYWENKLTFDCRNAYEATGKKPILPCPDHMNLGDEMVERLHSIGTRCQPIHPSNAAIPVFEVEIMPDINEKWTSQLWSISYPTANPQTDREFGVYGMNLRFSSNASHIACDIGYLCSDHSGGGYVEVGTVLIIPDDNYFITVPYSLNIQAYDDFGVYDYKSITEVCNWLGYLWRGIQYMMINRPEHITIHHQRISSDERKHVAKRNYGKYRTTKVQRNIYIQLEDEEIYSAPSAATRIYALPLWSVSGHWRTLKSGRKVWIAPYHKGKDRFKDNINFSPKEFQFV